ncbi:MAG: hypothetical protein AAGA48_41150, partial [Myxococcota bacterium]
NRITDIESSYNHIQSQLLNTDPAVRTAGALQALSLGIPGSISLLEDIDSGEQRDKVVAEISDRVTATVSSDQAAGEAPVENVDTPIDAEVLRAHMARLRHLTHRLTPICPNFVPPPDAERAASSSALASAAQNEAPQWLRQVSRARPNLRAMMEFLELSQLILKTPASIELAQSPYSGSEPWAGMHGVSTSGDRLCLLSLTGLVEPSQYMGGMLIDSWTDGVPSTEQLTGIAMHFDAPTSRAPNAILISMVDEAFSADEISDQLCFVLEMARARAVPMSQLQDVNPNGTGGYSSLGHYMPTFYLADDVEISGGTP